MSGTNDGNGRSDAINEPIETPIARLDQLLSLRQDGALDAHEAVELERLLASSDAARARANHFAAVDESLRRLAARSIPAARLERSLDALERRLGASEADDSRRSANPSRRRFVGLGLGLAAAAALALALLVLPRGDGDEANLHGTRVAASEVREDVSGTPTDASAEEGDVAEDLASLGIEEASDLEVIDELELLDFLATRDPLPEGPRG
jgi:anti-sigma factor RsiW